MWVVKNCVSLNEEKQSTVNLCISDWYLKCIQNAKNFSVTELRDEIILGIRFFKNYIFSCLFTFSAVCLHFQLFLYIYSILFTFSAVCLHFQLFFLHFQLFLYIYSCLFTFSADCWVFQLFIYIFSWLFTFFSYRQHMLCCWLCLPRRIWILPTPEWLFEILCLRFRWTASRIMQWRINVQVSLIFEFSHQKSSLKDPLRTVWKFQDFSVTQILREINFGEFWSSKYAIYAIFGTQNFVYLLNFSLQNVPKT